MTFHDSHKKGRGNNKNRFRVLLQNKAENFISAHSPCTTHGLQAAA